MDGRLVKQDGILEEWRMTGMKRWKEGKDEDRQPAIHPEFSCSTCSSPFRQQDKAIKRTKVSNIVETAAIRDMEEASVYKGTLHV
jgi:ribosomal protein S26